MRDRSATQRRILEAATAEFSQYGIAGARVDRIAETAQANKALIYQYFGSKAQLFDAVWEANVEVTLQVAQLDPADLPGYAVSLYDAWLEHPELIRLGTWARLERTPTGHLLPPGLRAAAYRLDQIADAQRQGSVRADVDAFDLLAMLLSLSMSWSPASMTVAATRKEPRATHERRRRALREAAALLVTGDGPSDR